MLTVCCLIKLIMLERNIVKTYGRECRVCLGRESKPIWKLSSKEGWPLLLLVGRFTRTYAHVHTGIHAPHTYALVHMGNKHQLCWLHLRRDW